MPTLNFDKCYEYIYSPSLDEKTTDKLAPLPRDWLQVLIDKVASTDDRPKTVLHDQVFKHINGSSSYPEWTILKSSLQKLYYFVISLDLTSPPHEYIKESIHDAIKVGVSECTPGYHDRIERVLIGLDFPHSFTGLISNYRYEITDKAGMQFSAALKSGDEVHAHNYFFTIALQCGYGIKAINAKDTYNSGVSSEQVQQILADNFARKYTFFNVLFAVKQSLKGRLSYYGYTCELDIGYTGDILGNITDLFKRFFDDLSLELLFRYNTEGKIIDLNWRYIDKLLLSKLIEIDYFNLDTLDKTAVSVIANIISGKVTTETLGEITTKEFYRFFISLEELTSFILFADYLSDEYKTVIIANYLNTPNVNLTTDDISSLVSKLEQSLLVSIFKKLEQQFYDNLFIKKSELISFLQKTPLSFFIVFCNSIPKSKLYSILQDAEGLDLILRSLSSRRLMLFIASVSPESSRHLVKSFFQLFLILRFLPESYKKELINLIDDEKLQQISHDIHQFPKVLRYLSYQSQLDMILKFEHSHLKENFCSPNIFMYTISVLNPLVIPIFINIIGDKQFIQSFANYGRLKSRINHFELSGSQKEVLSSMYVYKDLKENHPNKTTRILRIFSRDIPNYLTRVTNNDASKLVNGKPFYRPGLMR